MRRFGLLLSVVVVALLGLGVLGSPTSTRAQEGTPAAESFEFAPGVVGYPLAFAEGQEGPVLYRVTVAPGAILAGGQIDPAISLVSVEAGAVRVTIAAPVAITRGGGAGTPEIVAAGTEFTAEVGDYFVTPPSVAGEYRNDGQEEVSVLVASILPSTMAPAAPGTPTP
jgi:hypothetical protein